MKRKQTETEKVIMELGLILTKCQEKNSANASGLSLFNEKMGQSFGYLDRITQLEMENISLQ